MFGTTPLTKALVLAMAGGMLMGFPREGLAGKTGGSSVEAFLQAEQPHKISRESFPLYAADQSGNTDRSDGKGVADSQRAVPFSGKCGIAWTKSWFSCCRKRFKSFNPETGQYLTYSGRYRLCR